MTEQQFMSADETDRYIDERIQKALKQRPKRGIIQRAGGLVWGLLWLVLICTVIAVFAFALRVQYGIPIPLPASLVATAGVAFSTAAAPLPTAARVQQQPAGAHGPRYTPFYGDAQEATAEPTLTILPAPTATESFWTPEEQTQIAATATAFIEVIPTAPPEFIGYVDERCRDAGAVEESLTLQLFCKK